MLMTGFLAVQKIDGVRWKGFLEIESQYTSKKKPLSCETCIFIFWWDRHIDKRCLALRDLTAEIQSGNLMGQMASPSAHRLAVFG